MTKSEICGALEKCREYGASAARKGKTRKYGIRHRNCSIAITVSRKTVSVNIHGNDCRMLMALSIHNDSIREICFDSDGYRTLLRMRTDENMLPVIIPLRAGRKRQSIAALVRKRKLRLFTDGGCSPDPVTGRGPGGWSYIIVSGDRVIASMARFREDTTSTEMEAHAILKGLERLKGTAPGSITVYSDHQGIIDPMNRDPSDKETAISKYLARYRKLEANLPCPVHWKWTKGHSSCCWNNFCDKAIRDIMKKHAEKRPPSCN